MTCLTLGHPYVRGDQAFRRCCQALRRGELVAALVMGDLSTAGALLCFIGLQPHYRRPCLPPWRASGPMANASN